MEFALLVLAFAILIAASAVGRPQARRGVFVVDHAELPEGYVPPSASLTPPKE